MLEKSKVAVNGKRFRFVLSVGGQISEYSKCFSYVATIGYIEWNHENKSPTYWNLNLSKENKVRSIELHEKLVFSYLIVIVF